MDAYKYILQLKDSIEVQGVKIQHFMEQYSMGYNQISDIDKLSSMSANFKGYKPVSVTLPDGTKTEVNKWKDVATLILKDSLESKAAHAYISKLVDYRTSGRNRRLFTTNKDELHSPLEIEKGIYFESYFDTESLLNVMKDYVLKPIGYDIDNVWIEYADNAFFEQEFSQDNEVADMQLE